MGITITKCGLKERREKLEKNFDIEIYNQYAQGKIKYCEMLYLLKTEVTTLNNYLKEHNLPKRLNIIKDNLVENFFDVIDNEDKAYLLGFFLADGNVCGNRITVSISECDKEIVELFNEKISPKSIIKKLKGKKNKDGSYTKPMVVFSTSSFHMSETLTKYGIGDRKTYNENIDLSFLTKECFPHFLRGYFDGDGTVYVGCVNRKLVLKNGETKCYKSTNYNWNIISYTDNHLIYLATCLKDFFNIKAHVLQEKRGYYLLQVNSKEDFFRLRSLMYSNAKYCLKRKRDKYFSYEYGKPKRIIVKYKEGNVVEEYNTLTEAGNANGVTGSCIRQRITKKLIVDGCEWKYEYKEFL